MPDDAEKTVRQEEGKSGGNEKSGTSSGQRNRGFAGMDQARQREIARAGGRAAHQQGRAHEFTPEEAREAGRKGGRASGGARQRAAARNRPEQSGMNNPDEGKNGGMGKPPQEGEPQQQSLLDREEEQRRDDEDI